MLWGDTLFTPYTKKVSGDSVSCTPNTLTYEFNIDEFPEIKNSQFGIYIHSVIDEKFDIRQIKDIGDYISNVPDDIFVLGKNDLIPRLENQTSLLAQLEEANDMAMDIAPKFTVDIGKDIDMAVKSGVDIADEIMSNHESDGKIDAEYAEKVQEAYLRYV